MYIYVLLAVCAVFGVLRFILPVSGKVEKKDIFKSLAHVFVGGLFGAAFTADRFWDPYGTMAVGLTILEVIAFFARRKITVSAACLFLVIPTTASAQFAGPVF